MKSFCAISDSYMIWVSHKRSSLILKKVYCSESVQWIADAFLKGMIRVAQDTMRTYKSDSTLSSRALLKSIALSLKKELDWVRTKEAIRASSSEAKCEEVEKQ